MLLIISQLSLSVTIKMSIIKFQISCLMSICLLMTSCSGGTSNRVASTPSSSGTTSSSGYSSQLSQSNLDYYVKNQSGQQGGTGNYSSITRQSCEKTGVYYASTGQCLNY